MSYTRFFVSTILASGFFAATPGYAQADQEAVNESENSAIIVTARKRQEKLIDVPLAVSVTTEAQLNRDQIFNISDLQRVTPALEISQTFGGNANGGGRLRGIGTGVFNQSVSPSVAFVIDQVPVGNLSFPHLFDLGQVEVLRGPQGTLFGQGASAGVVNVSTVAPTMDEIKVSGGVDFADKGTAGAEVGELLVRGAFNLPIGDRAAFRVSAQYKKETGLQRNVTTGVDNKIEDFGIRVRALLKPSDLFTVNLNAEYSDNETNGETFFAIAIAPNSTTLFDPPGPALPVNPIGPISNAAYTNPADCAVTITERAEEYCSDTVSDSSINVAGLSAVMDLEVSDTVNLTSVTAYRERKFSVVSRDFSRLTNAPAARDERIVENSRQFSQELRAAYSGDGIDIVVGGVYSDFRYEESPLGQGPFVFGAQTPGDRIGFGVCFNAGTFCPVPVRFTKEVTTNRTLAFFTDATFSVTDQLDIFGGLRYSDYSNTTRIGMNTLTPTSSFKTDDNDLSGRIGLSFKPSIDSTIFASYSRGYKPPAVGTNAAGALFQLAPEQANAFELGAKVALGGIQLSANAFYSEIQNFQSQTNIFVGTALISQPLNIDKVVTKGFEISAFGEVLPGLNVNTGYQYNIVKFPTGFIGDDGVDIGGTQFLFAPKHKLTLSADYSVPVSDGLDVFVNANLVYKSKILLAARSDPRFRFRAHELVNGGIGLRHPDGKWTASVFVRNLTKSREPTSLLASTFGGQTDGGLRAWPVAGLTTRVVGVRAGFDF